MNIEQINIIFGWTWILTGMIVGATLGLWSFNGPLKSPIGDYNALPRRMIRLAHIAFIALGVINILYGMQIDKLNIAEDAKTIGCLSLIAGTALMPTLLIISAFFKQVKYFLAIPATLLILGLFIIILSLLSII